MKDQGNTIKENVKQQIKKDKTVRYIPPNSVLVNIGDIHLQKKSLPNVMSGSDLFVKVLYFYNHRIILVGVRFSCE